MLKQQLTQFKPFSMDRSPTKWLCFLQYLFWVFIVAYSIIKSSLSIDSLSSLFLYDLITKLLYPSKRKVLDFEKGILS